MYLARELTESGCHPEGAARNSFSLINPVVKKVDLERNYLRFKNCINLRKINTFAEVYMIDPNNVEESAKEGKELLDNDTIAITEV